jgi:DNA-binding NarL/FixJ family response regulator
VTKRAPIPHLVPLSGGQRQSTPGPSHVSDDSDPVRVLVIESDPAFGGDLVVELTRVKNRLVVVGWASEADGAIALAQATDPDVVLVGQAANAELERVATRMKEASSAPIVALVDPAADVATAGRPSIDGFIPRVSQPAEIARSFFEIALLALASSGAGSD